MIHFVFSKNDTRFLFLKGDNDEDRQHIKEFAENCNLIDPICYLPTWGNRPKITQDFVFEYVQQTGQKIWYCSIGLWQEAFKFFKKKEYEYDGLVENENLFKRKIQHTLDEFKTIIDSWHLNLKPRPYQYEAAYNILCWNSSLSELSTRSGKTLIMYLIYRYAIEYLNVKKILMIVPSIQLVKQGYDDFSEYGEFFNTECIWSGGKLVESSNLTIGTFQSLIGFLDRKSKKYNPHFFDNYDLVAVDETHRATAKQIKTIITQPFMKNVKLKFGVTGTLPKEHTIPFYCLHALLGAQIQTIKANELMDEEYKKKIDITQIRLNYTDVLKQQKLFIKCAEYTLSDFVYNTKVNKNGKEVKEKIKLPGGKHQLMYKKQLPFGIETAKNRLKLAYTNENEFYDQYVNYLKSIIVESPSTNLLVIERYMTHFMDERKQFLYDKIIPICDKNTLILAHHTTYIEEIYEDLQKLFPTRHIAKITGAVTPKKREKIKQLMKENNDVILVASFGTLSTGITLSNLCYGVMFESFKSNVINIQSLGRGLGLSDLKDKYKVFDIIDCFDKKKISNKIYLQGLAKLKIYKEEKYPFEVKNINI